MNRIQLLNEIQSVNNEILYVAAVKFKFVFNPRTKQTQLTYNTFYSIWNG